MANEFKPEQVPDEVWMAARLEFVDGPIREDMEDRYRHAIAAALNAWPGGHMLTMVPQIILPIPQETSNGK